ncbi:hypothetical protein HMPREF2914_18685 [Pseudomonas sp. HMSC067G02]|nr:hypothetical protein D480_0209630 [Pseudomonas aeruginosa]KJC21328.1 hypothetical protein TN45_18660 [Pseudomonas aeruginosa]OFQ93973.1 hypothetical protein HMPREF2914_18685 [Pseudomonas sp. HMSC067G02]
MPILGDSPFHKGMVFYLVEMPPVGDFGDVGRKYVLGYLYKVTPARTATELGVVAEYIPLRPRY